MIGIALLLLAADVAPATAVCYAAEPAPDEKLLVVARADRSVEMITKGLTLTACPAELVWNADAAKDQCEFYAHYDALQRFYFEDLYGVSPKEVCNEGRRAAGLNVKEEKAE